MAISSQVFMAIGWKSLKEIFFFDFLKLKVKSQVFTQLLTLMSIFFVYQWLVFGF